MSWTKSWLLSTIPFVPSGLEVVVSLREFVDVFHDRISKYLQIVRIVARNADVLWMGCKVAERRAALVRLGYRNYRVTNDDVMRNLSGVLDVLLH